MFAPLRITLMFIVLLSASLPLRAAQLLTDGAGTLLGALDVDVNGFKYDVYFGGTSCVEVFSGCDSVTDFAFRSEAEAVAASQALLDQVLLDGAPPDTFDTDPETNTGCTNSGLCRVFTPYTFDGSGNPLGVTADNHSIPGDPDVVTTSIFVAPTTDLSAIGPATFAVWTGAEADVPLPGWMLLPLLGFFGIVHAQRERRLQAG